MTVLHTLPIAEILERGTIVDTDVASIRRSLYLDGIVNAAEASALFKLNSNCTVVADGWSDIFIEGVTDYIINQEKPHGYLTGANADWLLAQVSHGGFAAKRNEIELIVNVLDKARWAPVSLSKFALEQVKRAVVTAEGPLRASGRFQPGVILASEVDLLRRILYAFGGDGHVAVTRDEADVLFDIDEAVAQSAANPAWTDLFVKAVANVIMASSGYRVPTREEALRHESTLVTLDQQTSVLAFLLSMVSANLSAIKDAYQDQTAEERALARLEHQRIEIITHEAITEVEASWLAARIGRDGRLTPSETALVAYLKQDGQRLHPALVEAIAHLGAAA